MADKQGAAKIVMDVAHPNPMVSGNTDSTDNTDQKPFGTKMRIEPPQGVELSDVAVESKPSETVESFTDEPAEKSQAQQDIEYTDIVNKLIGSRQYYLPINQVQRRRTKQLVRVMFVAAIVIGLGWTYLLLDASIVTIPGITVPTHFFK